MLRDKPAPGIVVEYANQALPRPTMASAYTGRPGTTPSLATRLRCPVPDETIDMVFEKVPGGPHGINHWLVNGKEYPHQREFMFRHGRHYRLVFHDIARRFLYPLHMHRHLFRTRRNQR